MKKFRIIAILLGVALVGFVLGWATASGDVPGLKNVAKEFPMLPAPPKTDAVQLAAPPQPDKDVILETPEEGTRPLDMAQGLQPPAASFDVSGRAKADMTDVRITVTDSTGANLANMTAPVTTTAGEPYGRFSTTVVLPALPSAPVTLHVGRDTDGAVTVDRLVLYGQADNVTLQVFFMNDKKGGVDQCDLVYPVQRSVSGQAAIYRAAIEALLAGPNADEVAAGFRTAIPAGVELKSVAADADGVVTADFTSRLTAGLTESCPTQSIRAEIGATLKQFPEVRDIVITVGGNKNNVLQP